MKTDTAKLNWPLIGNGQVFEFLAKSLVNKNVAGSYIFTGPANIGKTTAAYYFAGSLVCESRGRSAALPCGVCPACREAAKGTHGDIYLIKKSADKKNISVEQVRDFIRNLGLSSFLNSYKIGIIKGAEDLSEGAVNALLKTLEEPKAKVVIILTVDGLEALPKTIISRSRILRFRPVGSEAIYDDLVKNHRAQRSQAKNFSRLSGGRPALALKFLEDREFFAAYEKTVKGFVDLLSPNLSERFKAVENLLGGGTGPEAAGAALKILDTWRNLTRDLMLMELNLADLVQHELFMWELEPLKSRLSLKALLNLQNNLRLSQAYVSANVSPKLALESAAVSF